MPNLIGGDQNDPEYTGGWGWVGHTYVGKFFRERKIGEFTYRAGRDEINKLICVRYNDSGPHKGEKVSRNKIPKSLKQAMENVYRSPAEDITKIFI